MAKKISNKKLRKEKLKAIKKDYEAKKEDLVKIDIELSEESLETLLNAAKKHKVSLDVFISYLLREYLMKELKEKNKDEFSDVISSIDLQKNIKYWLKRINKKKRYLKKPILVFDYLNLSNKGILLPKKHPYAKFISEEQKND